MHGNYILPDHNGTVSLNGRIDDPVIQSVQDAAAVWCLVPDGPTVRPPPAALASGSEACEL